MSVRNIILNCLIYEEGKMDIEKIYRIYFEDVYRFLLSLSKNKEVAQDITSETFLKVINNSNKIEKTRNIKAYIFTIAKNTYINYYNKNKIMMSTDDIEKFDQGIDSFEENLIESDNVKVLNDAIDKLDEPYRSITKLRLNDLSFKEIGKIYGKTSNWACVCYYRAKEKLKDILEDDCGL